MSSSSGKTRGESDEDQIPSKLLDLFQPLNQTGKHDLEVSTGAHAEPVSNQLSLQTSYGNAAVAQTLIQRKAEGENDAQGLGMQTAPTALASLIVEDNVEVVGPGQMKKSQFLAELKGAVCGTAAQALAGTAWSAVGCPYIERAFAHYANQSSDYIERGIRRYAPEAAGSPRFSV